MIIVLPTLNESWILKQVELLTINMNYLKNNELFISCHTLTITCQTKLMKKITN